MYDQLKLIADQVGVLQKTLDDKVATIEAWQSKMDTKISAGRQVPNEALDHIKTINNEIDVKIAEYKALVNTQKDLALAPQRPGYAANYPPRHKHATPAPTKPLQHC